MTPDPTTMRWRKSTYSSGQNGDCVEVAYVGAVRDSKNPTGPALPVGDLPAFLHEVKCGRLGSRHGRLDP
jgi:hypothetical protein